MVERFRNCRFPEMHFPAVAWTPLRKEGPMEYTYTTTFGGVSGGYGYVYTVTGGRVDGSGNSRF